ncbi:MAG: glycosyltransferase family 2 protein, partial [Candidatus Wallbacteria bacterium]|nr:glycosyltransferase family 2 protein [Candidatus Wallbacteria bacterium]
MIFESSLVTQQDHKSGPYPNGERSAISIIVPVFDEGEAIRDFLHEARLHPEIGEVLLVEDGSSVLCLDAALEESRGMDLQIRYLGLSRNVGKDRAVLTGLSSASCPDVAVMDADLQFPFEEMLRMWRLLNDHNRDIVLGVKTGYFSPWNFLYRVVSVLCCAHPPAGNLSDFVVARSPVLKEHLLSYIDAPVFSLKGVLGRISSNMEYCPVTIVPRRRGSTRMNVSML